MMLILSRPSSSSSSIISGTEVLPLAFAFAITRSISSRFSASFLNVVLRFKFYSASSASCRASSAIRASSFSRAVCSSNCLFRRSSSSISKLCFYSSSTCKAPGFLTKLLRLFLVDEGRPTFKASIFPTLAAPFSNGTF